MNNAHPMGLCKGHAERNRQHKISFLGRDYSLIRSVWSVQGNHYRQNWCLVQIIALFRCDDTVQNKIYMISRAEMHHRRKKLWHLALLHWEHILSFYSYDAVIQIHLFKTVTPFKPEPFLEVISILCNQHTLTFQNNCVFQRDRTTHFLSLKYQEMRHDIC